MEYIFLVVGFVLLVKGADFFVDGSSSVAKRLRVPSLIIGMTIVAMGTSLPECSVSISAALAHNTGVAVGNAVGSNIFNLMVVCGICALFCPLTVDKKTLRREFPFSVFVAILLLVLGWISMELGRWDGIMLVLFFALFLFIMVTSALEARKNEGQASAKASAEQPALASAEQSAKTSAKADASAVASAVAEEEYKILPVWQCILYIIGGAAAIAWGGDMVVDSASIIAKTFGMSQNLIGLTIVAFGTSLPELVTSVVAAKKKEVDMALGNVIGSNIFNILLVLGVAAAISPMAFNMENVIDIIVLVVMSVIVLCFAWTKEKIVRWEGGVMLALYAAYVGYICIR